MFKVFLSSFQTMIAITAIFFVGACIGWLIGLSKSDSPVVPGVLSALLGICTILVLYKGNQETSSEKSRLTLNQSLILLASLCFGIFVFSNLSIMTRDNVSLILFKSKIEPIFIFEESANKTGLLPSSDKKYKPLLYNSSSDICSELLSVKLEADLFFLLEKKGEPWSYINKQPIKSRADVLEIVCNILNH